jgi:hypothetical protein
MNIENAKKDFVNILLLRKNIINIFEKISSKMDSLKQLYKDMIKSNAATEEASIFCIDAFLFQHKLIEIEYDNIIAVFKTIDNRIYYEHHKLYKMVQDYMKKEFSSFDSTLQMLSKNFPVYKQLDTMKEYDISYTTEMQTIIVKTITDVSSYLEKREIELTENKKQIEKGIKIDNLIHIQNYHNAIVKSNIDMFSQYLHTFNRHNTNYLTELLNRSLRIIENVNKNIKTNNSDNHIDIDFKADVDFDKSHK